MPDLVSTLDQIFSNRVFHIPDYQRGYAWGGKQWDDLTQDLELLPLGRNHFTGTLVLCPGDHGFSEVRDRKGWLYSVCDIIDGQQRLATLVLLLSAIYVEMRQIDSLQDMADGLREKYLAVRNENQEWLTKLTLNQDCQDYYFSNVLGNNVLGLAPGIEGPTIRSHQLLAEARDHFAEYLAQKHVELGIDYTDWLRDLYFKITQHLTLIVYKVDSTTDAGVIFETMNDRGRPLTEIEKVKNYFLYIASKLDLPAEHDLSEQINQTWKHIFEKLMAAGLGTSAHEDRLLRAHWLMAYDPDPRNWKQSRSIKKEFNLRGYQERHPQLLRDLKDYLCTLKSAATAYCDIHCPGHQTAFNDCADDRLRAQIVNVNEKLVRLGTRATFLPLLMAVRLRANDGGETYLKTAELCEKFDFRVYQWLRHYATAGRPRLLRLAHRFFQDQDAQRLLYGLAQAVLYYCSNRRFEERFSSETENWYTWGGLKYCLYEYEQHLAREQRKPVQVSWQEVWSVKRDTIEHILPQTPTDAYWQERFTEAQRERWTHDIGNLTLTYDNICLGNKPFPDKRGEASQPCCYASSKLFIEHRLARYQDWSETQIQERREQIKQWALERWHVKVPDPPPPPSPPPGEAGTRPETAKERLLRLAREKGTEEAFRAILDASMQHSRHLYPRMHTFWRVVKFTPLQNKNKALFWLGVDLWVGFVYENFERFLGIPAEEARAILGPEKDYVLEKSQADEFIARLDRLIERLQEIQEANAP